MLNCGRGSTNHTHQKQAVVSLAVDSYTDLQSLLDKQRNLVQFTGSTREQQTAEATEAFEGRLSLT